MLSGKQARRKVPLDEAWLGGLLPDAKAPPASQPVEETPGTSQALAPPEGGPRVDWGDALAVTTFYGRGHLRSLDLSHLSIRGRLCTGSRCRMPP